MATRPDTAEPTVNPQSPPEMPPLETPAETPVERPDEIEPPQPDIDEPAREIPETPMPPD